MKMISIAFGLLLGIAHYFSDRIHLQYILHKPKLISFAAGISISFLFLELLPELFRGIEYLHKLSIFFLLIGFTSFHLIEKYVYQHTLKNHKKIKRQLKKTHSIAFFIYHFIVGISLTLLTRINFTEGILFFIPLFFHTTVSSVSMNEIEEKAREKTIVKLLLSGSTLLGVLLTFLVPIALSLYHLLIGFVLGALLYVVIRDFIPKEKEGNPLFFVVGVILYTLLIGLTWVIFQ